MPPGLFMRHVTWPTCSANISLMKPICEHLKCLHVSSVMLLCEFKQHRPCEIWIYSWIACVH
jgi:hypothetical protein